jgi:hypothetical protein
MHLPASWQDPGKSATVKPAGQACWPNTLVKATPPTLAMPAVQQLAAAAAALKVHLAGGVSA